MVRNGDNYENNVVLYKKKGTVWSEVIQKVWINENINEKQTMDSIRSGIIDLRRFCVVSSGAWSKTVSRSMTLRVFILKLPLAVMWPTMNLQNDFIIN